jgi:hypothetical protein
MGIRSPRQDGFCSRNHDIVLTSCRALPAQCLTPFTEPSTALTCHDRNFPLKAPVTSGVSLLCIRIVSRSSESAAVSPAE